MLKIIFGLVGMIVVVLAGVFGFYAYYSQTIARNARNAENAWINVEQEFRHRAELTPAIITMVSSINDTQGALIDNLKTRQAAILALKSDPDAPKIRASFRDFMKTQDALSQQFGLVYDFLKYYPDQVRDAKIRKILDALEQSEAAIVRARNQYSSLANNLNGMLATPPQSWIASLLKPRPEKLIENFDLSKN